MPITFRSIAPAAVAVAIGLTLITIYAQLILFDLLLPLLGFIGVYLS